MCKKKRRYIVIFNFGKGKFIELHAVYLTKLVECKIQDATSFIKSHGYTDVLWGIAKHTGSKSNPDVQGNIQSLIELLLDTHEAPDTFEIMLEGCVLSSVVCRMFVVKAGASILKQGLFEGNEAELVKFRFDFEKFVEIPLNPFGTGETTILQLMQDPTAGLPITESAKQRLFND